MPWSFVELGLGQVVSQVLGAGVCDSGGVNPQFSFEVAAMLRPKVADGLPRDVVRVVLGVEEEPRLAVSWDRGWDGRAVQRLGNWW